MSVIRIPLTGFDEYIEDDQPALYATFGHGNGPEYGLQVHLQFVDPDSGTEIPIGWVRARDLQTIINTAVQLAPERTLTS